MQTSHSGSFVHKPKNFNKFYRRLEMSLNKLRKKQKKNKMLKNEFVSAVEEFIQNYIDGTTKDHESDLAMLIQELPRLTESTFDFVVINKNNIDITASITRYKKNRTK